MADAVRRAEQAFDAKRLRLTALRRLVLDEIIGSHRAIGAYEVMDRLAARGRRLAPISIYRSIDVLLEVGAIHRLESRNAYFACHHPHATDELRIVTHCTTCGCVAELSGGDVASRIDQATEQAGFEVGRRMIEISGRCAGCRRAGSPA